VSVRIVATTDMSELGFFIIGEDPNIVERHPSPKPAETMPSPRSLIAVQVEDIACPTVAKPRVIAGRLWGEH
jgi:hypothetical protein